jgi:hypothetical protein
VSMENPGTFKNYMGHPKTTLSQNLISKCFQYL